jgi:alkylresorcinol/alkylpyrone synthase
MSVILATATLNPPFKNSSKDIIEAMKKHWFPHMPKDVARKAELIFHGAEISQRYSALPLDVVLQEMSFEQKNNLYIESMIKMGTEVLQKALLENNLSALDLDGIITTSCTGFMIPSVDAHIINRLKMKQNIFRLPVTEMGCAGGTSGLIYADQFLKANPGKKIALVSVEIPSITFQPSDFSVENLVSTAIFADGASCVILGGDEHHGLRIVDWDMYHFPDAIHLMGYDLKNSGLKIVLDRAVPEQIKEHFPRILLPFLQKNKMTVEDVDHYMFHPGGKKIIQMVKNFIEPYGKNISESIDVLNQHGNMSSSTILYILDKKMKQNIKHGTGYMLAFGPGFMAQSLLLSWD